MDDFADDAMWIGCDVDQLYDYYVQLTAAMLGIDLSHGEFKNQLGCRI